MTNIESETIIRASTGAIKFLTEWFDDARFNHQGSILHIMISIKIMEKTVLRHNKSACADKEVLASMNENAEKCSETIFEYLKPYMDTLFEKKY